MRRRLRQNKRSSKSVRPAPLFATPQKFERFAPLSIHLSDVILEGGKLTPYKILNFQVRLNLEEVQNFNSPATVKEQIAQELANTILEQFKTVEFWPREGAKKIKLDTDIIAQDGQFGYYQLS